MFNRVLFICVGNICRSPLAEYWVRHRLQTTHPAIQVESAGLAAMQGFSIDPRSAIILDHYKIPSTTHCARQVTKEMMTKADLVFAMENWQVKKFSNEKNM